MEAMKKFWMTEDLLEHLLPMLDLHSNLALASASPLALSLIKHPLLWQQLQSSSWQIIQNNVNLNILF